MLISKFVPLGSLLAVDFKGVPGAVANNIRESLAPWKHCDDECCGGVVLQSAAGHHYS